ncbi:hypothetical protein PR048_017404 [Dryococelus australis]|uniref:Uncharacterized protein n=1 Tax=Dryococelus australis TaxID=614101 RepID=A0ABQ9H9J8_9NEOP|nr:hypothetical protein PR048_017404 [Dryococelus australis]
MECERAKTWMDPEETLDDRIQYGRHRKLMQQQEDADNMAAAVLTNKMVTGLLTHKMAAGVATSKMAAGPRHPSSKPIAPFPPRRTSFDSRTLPLVGGVFWGISRFPFHSVPNLLHAHLASPPLSLKTSMLTTLTYCYEAVRALRKYCHASKSPSIVCWNGIAFALPKADCYLEYGGRNPICWSISYRRLLCVYKLLCLQTAPAARVLIVAAELRLHYIKVDRVRFSAVSLPDFHRWESSRDIPFPPPLHSCAAPYSPRFTRIGSQDHDFYSPPPPKSLFENNIAKRSFSVAVLLMCPYSFSDWLLNSEKCPLLAGLLAGEEVLEGGFEPRILVASSSQPDDPRGRLRAPPFPRPSSSPSLVNVDPFNFISRRGCWVVRWVESSKPDQVGTCGTWRRLGKSTSGVTQTPAHGRRRVAGYNEPLGDTYQQEMLHSPRSYSSRVHSTAAGPPMSLRGKGHSTTSFEVTGIEVKGHSHQPPIWLARWTPAGLARVGRVGRLVISPVIEPRSSYMYCTTRQLAGDSSREGTLHASHERSNKLRRQDRHLGEVTFSRAYLVGRSFGFELQPALGYCSKLRIAKEIPQVSETILGCVDATVDASVASLGSGHVERCIGIPSENSETEPIWPHPLKSTFYGSLTLRDPLGQYSETANVQGHHFDTSYSMFRACVHALGIQDDLRMSRLFSLQLRFCWSRNIGVARADDVERRNTRAGETVNPPENPPASGIVQYVSHVRKSGSDTAGKRTWFAWVEGE